MRAAILEHDPRAGHQVFDGARGEDFTGTRQSSDPRADVYRKAADVVAHPLALTGMNPGPDFEAGLAETIADRDGAAHGRAHRTWRGIRRRSCSSPARGNSRARAEPTRDAAPRRPAKLCRPAMTLAPWSPRCR